MGFWILIALAVGAVLYAIVIYNGFIGLRATIEAAWSDIDVQLKRRFNLIPALVETVKSYKDYEQETLEQVIAARNRCRQAEGVKAQSSAQNSLGSALGQLFAVAEAYPELRADRNYAKLQDELTNLEGVIQNARRYYNAVVRDYNAKLKSFPDLLVANRFAFEERDYFELDEPAARSMPKIDL